MKRWNVVAFRGALRRGVQDQATDPERPFLLPVADNAVLKVEPAEGSSDIPRRTIRRCRMGVVSWKRNKPVHAAEAADGTLAPAVAAPLASSFAAYGGLAQMFAPPDKGM